MAKDCILEIRQRLEIDIQFLDCWKTEVYYSIIVNRLKNPIISGYTECHHIIPKSLGGNNSDENLVRLTAREHLICHLLLVGMTKNSFAKEKMIHAACFMSRRNKKRVNSRIYESLKMKQAAIARELQKSRRLSDETKKKISIRGKGRKVKKSTIEKMLKTKKKNGTTGHSVETRKKMSIAAKNREIIYKKCEKCSKVVEYKNYFKWHGENCGIKRKAWNSGKKMEERTCDVCGKVGRGGNMTRYHFDNCGKEKPPKTRNYRTCPHCNKTGSGGNMTRYHFENCRQKKND